MVFSTQDDVADFSCLDKSTFRTGVEMLSSSCFSEFKLIGHFSGRLTICGIFNICMYDLWGLLNLQLIMDPAGIDSIIQQIHFQ